MNKKYTGNWGEKKKTAMAIDVLFIQKYFAACNLTCKSD